MKQRYILAPALAFILAGCAGSGSNPDVGSGGQQVVGEGESTEITKEEFNQLPKNLSPEELEKRDDTSVVIRAGDDRTIKEYRIGGFLYAIQVIPKIGPPYYLVAADNQGNFFRTDKPEMLIPSWTLFEWD